MTGRVTLSGKVEPGTEIPIHRHPTKDESSFVLRGRAEIEHRKRLIDNR